MNKNMRTKLALFALLLPFFGYSQKNSIDLIGSFDLSYRALISQDFLGDSFIAEREGEVPKLNWRAGFNFNQRLSEKWFLKTGLRFASVGYRSAKKELRFGDQHDGSGGFDETSTRIQQLTIDYFFLEVPIMIRYEWKQEKWSPFFEGGISSSYYLVTRLTTSIDDDDTTRLDNQSDAAIPIYFVANASLGMNYNISEQWQAFGQSIFRFHLNPISNEVIKEYLYSLGLEMGIRRTF
jgi:hypothetical protein